jgi:hypothetical protein
MSIRGTLVVPTACMHGRMQQLDAVSGKIQLKVTGGHGGRRNARVTQGYVVSQPSPSRIVTPWPVPRGRPKRHGEWRAWRKSTRTAARAKTDQRS